MTSQLKLYCLLDGESASYVFAVSVDSADIVADIKDVIHRKRPVAFSDIDSCYLTLWRVSIYVPDTTDKAPIRLENLCEREKKILCPFDRLSELFPPELPKRTINVIIQRPTPGICEKNILSRVLPGLTYYRTGSWDPSGASTASPFSPTPAAVVDWDDFLPDVGSYTPCDSRKFGPDIQYIGGLPASPSPSSPPGSGGDLEDSDHGGPNDDKSSPQKRNPDVRGPCQAIRRLRALGSRFQRQFSSAAGSSKG